MMQAMRTTVDLPPAVHRRAKELAVSRGQSLSATVTELTIRGLSQLDEPAEITVHAESGFPVLSIGRPITTKEVADLVDEA